MGAYHPRAIATIAAELAQHELPRTVILCTFDALATSIMTEALAAATAGAGEPTAG
ncbi:MAG: hypothetical protein H0X17_14680 [Deltaproteobacteria bacterium]|nr:hypothetical protein [Deltaproteobacteria bacterium]